MTFRISYLFGCNKKWMSWSDLDFSSVIIWTHSEVAWILCATFRLKSLRKQKTEPFWIRRRGFWKALGRKLTNKMGNSDQMIHNSQAFFRNIDLQILRLYVRIMLKCSVGIEWWACNGVFFPGTCFLWCWRDTMTKILFHGKKSPLYLITFSC